MDNNYDIIRPFRFWVQSILPLVYDESLSYYEVLCKITGKLNEAITEINKLAQMPTDIEEEVQKALLEYVNSEEFEDYLKVLIAEYVPEEIGYSSKTIDVNRVMAVLNDTNIADDSVDHYVYPQSMAYNPDHNSIYVAYCSAVQAATQGQLVEYSLTDYSVIDSWNIRIGHANGMCYNKYKKRLVVCTLLAHSSSPCLTVFRTDEMAINQYVDLTYTPLSVSYDEENKQYYVVYQSNEVDVLNDSFEFVRSFRLKGPKFTGATTQDSDFHDNLLYVMRWRPNVINVYDKAGNNVANYNIPEWWNRYYSVRECEGITHIADNNFMISGYCALSPAGYQIMSSVGMCSFDYGMINDEWAQNRLDEGASSSNAMNIYVDTAYTGVNPNGTQTAPFRTIQEAFETAHSPWIDRDIVIKAKGTERFPNVARGINRSMTIMQYSSGNALNMKQIDISYCLRVYIDDGHQFVNDANNYPSININGSLVSIGINKIVKSAGASYAVYCTGGQLDVRGEFTGEGYEVPIIGLARSVCTLPLEYDTSKVKLASSDVSVNRPLKIGDDLPCYTDFSIARATKIIIKYGTSADTQYPYFTEVYKAYPSDASFRVVFIYGSSTNTTIARCDITQSGTGNTGFAVSNWYYSQNGGTPVSGKPESLYILGVYVQ